MVNYYLSAAEQAPIIGTWYPTGYHGHYRSKSRIEFSNLYRQYAKPKPPEKFRSRLDDDATKHTFSKHDNRQIFLNDPTLFGSGLGKKKIDSVNKSKWNPEFIAWAEKSANQEASKKESIYQHDFCKYLNNSKLLTGRKNLETKPISVYEYAYSHGEPKADLSKSVRLETYHRYISKARARSNTPSERVTVASCLVWQQPTSSASHYSLADSTTNSIVQSESTINLNATAQSRPKTVAVCRTTSETNNNNSAATAE